ncbi:hypothetical protein [Leucothrix mucor]|uniref:hypothetical protein n=1 Tax=Leucothrix mucor TaxID=45248 RepID=UPI0003B437DD|nr:hypothetical protein [Leucothrix mucor]
MMSDEPAPPVPAITQSASDELVDINPVISTESVSEGLSETQSPVIVLDAAEVSGEIAETAKRLAVEVEVSEPESISSDIAEVLAEVEEAVSTEDQLDQDESAQEVLAQPEAQEAMPDQQVASENEQPSVEIAEEGSELASVESGFDTSEEEQGTEPMLAVDSDVDVLPEQTGFLDLNLTETTSIDLKLIEGDDLILDDINEDLTKYQTVVASVAADPELVPETLESVEVELNSATGDTAEIEVAETSVLVSGETPEPAVISIPDPDDELMNGVGELSEQYRETYAKLQLVTSKLSRADEKNKALKDRFVEAASQNREMDEKINLINQKIIELTTK